MGVARRYYKMGPVMLVSPGQTFPPLWEWDSETGAYRVVEDLQIARVLADIPARLDVILEEVVVHLGGASRSSLPVPFDSEGLVSSLNPFMRAVPP